jgi:hypothetical protein
MIRKIARRYILSPRPSKTRLYRLLKRDLNKRTECVVADISTSNFTNVHLFKNPVYFGVDIDEEALRKGINNLSSQNCKTDFINSPVSKGTIDKYTSRDSNYKIAVKGNILDQNIFPSCSIDVIVSTNTLIPGHINTSNYYSVIKSFCDYIAEDGYMYLNLPKDALNHKIHNLLSSRFEKTSVTSYGNEISDRYEKYLENSNGRVNSSDNLFIKTVQYTTSLILSELESIYLQDTTMLYIRCEKRI